MCALAFVLVACGGDEEPANDTPEKELSSGVALENFDNGVKPNNDFNMYVNGTWIENNPVPESKSRWGSFNEVHERNNEILHGILERCAKEKGEKGSEIQQIGDFYRTAMDSAKLDADGIKPVMKYLDMVQAVESKEELAKTLCQLHKNGLHSFIGFGYGPDLKNREVKNAQFGVGRTGLPNRAYYEGTGPQYERYQEEYRKHIARVFEIVGIKDGAAIADKMYSMENTLVLSTLTPVERRDPAKRYNKMTYDEFKAIAPSFNWDGYIEATGSEKPDTLICSEPAYFKTFGQVWEKTDLQVLKDYLRFFIVANASNFLGSELEQAHFEFYGKVLQGQKKMDPRWKRVLGIMNRQLGFVLGKEYVKEAFTEDSKKRVNAFIDNLQEVFRARLDELAWMSPETKEKALEKLNAFNRKIGYPDKWEDYSGMEIGTESYLENFYATNRFQYEKMMAERKDPIDKTRWGMPPQTVNAYYNPLLNEIVFPAGILQPPFFYPDAEDAINYGSIGGVIGHEFLHGFDDQGSKFNALGQLNDWWTPEDRAKFTERTDKLVYQFGQFRVLDSLPVNGALTLGENIADLGGLTMSYLALQKYIEQNGNDTIDGFSAEQRFFIGWAQAWRANSTDDALRRLVLTDPHAPPRFRINGPLSNMPQFHAAFGIQEGDPMYRPDSVRVKIW